MGAPNPKLKPLGGHKWVLGRVETLDFPELQIQGVECFVNTGVYSNILYCLHIDEEWVADQKMIRVVPLPPRERFEPTAISFFPWKPQKQVRNERGEVEVRYVIHTKVRVFGVEIPIELSLKEAFKVKYRVVLGRSFLKTRFLVDVGAINQSAQYEKRRRS
ncbi:MAG: RimK/LysX family protein [Flavobacteriales bacterium]|nr:RimK/LysX family protein [Flavobacteriales bacterium]MCX7767439.1 RimK/LysX family protein [Flavobacteriales bacterium]MDW8410047.1 RimK/LysX family protein [Flavobacteriales bacterium]